MHVHVNLTAESGVDNHGKRLKSWWSVAKGLQPHYKPAVFALKE